MLLALFFFNVPDLKYSICNIAEEDTVPYKSKLDKYILNKIVLLSINQVQYGPFEYIKFCEKKT